MAQKNKSAWAPKLLHHLSVHPPQDGAEEQGLENGDEEEIDSCVAALIENPQREVGLSLFDLSTNTMRLMQYIETGKLAAVGLFLHVDTNMEEG